MSSYLLKRKFGLMVAVVTTSGVLAVCGAGGGVAAAESTTQAAPGRAATAVASDFNEADVTFVQSMIPHHSQAVEMAALARKRASNSAVKRLAARIEAAQSPEIRQMRALLADWGRAESPGMTDMDHSSMGGMDMEGMDKDSREMPGMMSSAEMASLKNAKGKKFDRLFLTMMTKHHRGAIEMAKVEQKEGENAEAKALAGKIVRAQTVEIARMKKLLAA